MKKSVFAILLFQVVTVNAGSYKTLPASVNMIVIKQVSTSRIISKFNDHSNPTSLSLDENLNAKKLESISNLVQSYFNELRSISATAYEQFSLGEFTVDASAQASAQGIALAHGLTDHLTIYGTIPVYHIETQIDFKQKLKSNLAEVRTLISNSPTKSAYSTFIRQLTLQLPETNEELMQSVLVNYYGYKSLGNWKVDALGDLELGAIYRLSESADKGMAIALGTVLPTGKADDPDSLQDVATGDGQVDLFVESMMGASFLKNMIEFDLKNRFTYQLPSNKNVRLIDDSNIPISKDKAVLLEKLGNKFETTFTTTINPTSWFNINSSLNYSTTGQTLYSTKNNKIKSALEDNTATRNLWAKIGFGFSSIDFYKAKIFDIPLEINLSAQKLLNARNSAEYKRYDLDLRMYF